MYFPAPRCEPLQWPQMGQATYNKIIVDQKYPLDTEAVYSCYDGYSLGSSGWRKRTCQESGHWTGWPKYCFRKYYSSVTNWLHHRMSIRNKNYHYLSLSFQVIKLQVWMKNTYHWQNWITWEKEIIYSDKNLWFWVILSLFTTFEGLKS